MEECGGDDDDDDVQVDCLVEETFFAEKMDGAQWLAVKYLVLQ